MEETTAQAPKRSDTMELATLLANYAGLASVSQAVALENLWVRGTGTRGIRGCHEGP